MATKKEVEKELKEAVAALEAYETEPATLFTEDNLIESIEAVMGGPLKNGKPLNTILAHAIDALRNPSVQACIGLAIGEAVIESLTKVGIVPLASEAVESGTEDTDTEG